MATYLFTPADQPDKLHKALQSDADWVIADLEDGVAPQNKSAAREALLSLLDQPGSLGTPRLIVRCHAPGMAEFDADRDLLQHRQIDAIMLSKWESAEDLTALPHTDTEIIPLVESALGLIRLPELVAWRQRVRKVAFGAVDFALSLGVEWTPEGIERRHAMGQLVLQSAALGLEPPIDAVFPDLSDEAKFRSDVHYGAGMGFGGKMIIHPRQLGVVKEVYRPSPDRVEWARRTLQAWEEQGRPGAFLLDNKLVDEPVLKTARLLLARSW